MNLVMWPLNRIVHLRVARGLCLAGGTFLVLSACALSMGAAAADPTTGAAASTRAGDDKDAALRRMEAEKFNSKDVQAADIALYLEQLRADMAEARARAALQDANAQINQKVVASRAHDMDVRRKLFEAQAIYNVCIFVAVMVVVAAGLWFSFLQFTSGRRTMSDLRALVHELQALQHDDPLRPLLAARLVASDNQAAHAFEAGPLKITSNVIGLVVLAMSLAFFYLYLDRVYTLNMERSGLGSAVVDVKSSSSVLATGAAAPALLGK